MSVWRCMGTAIVGVAALVSCGEDAPLSAGPPTITRTETVSPGAECEAGGVRTLLGADIDGDGVLSAGEVDSTEIACNDVSPEPDRPGPDNPVPDDPPSLGALELSIGPLNEPFRPSVTTYAASVRFLTTTVSVRAAADAPATLTVNGQSIVSGMWGAPIELSEGTNRVTIEVANGELRRVYSVDIDRSSAQTFVERALTTASNSARLDSFGCRIALDGDTLAVAACGEASAGTGVNGGDQADDSAESSGAVYVFRQRHGQWQQEAYLKASNTDPVDRFGGSIALSGDTLVVGARLEDSDEAGINGDGQSRNSARNAGAVYVFRRTGDGWRQEAYVKASNPDPDDQFGTWVAVSGNTLAVGAPREDGSGTGVNSGLESDNSVTAAGAVYVFRRRDGQWQQEAYVKASNTGAGDVFGSSVALDGDTLAVGATGESSSDVGVDGDEGDDSYRRAGAVYVFVRSGEQWRQQAYLKASNTDPDDSFGWSLALDRDTLAVGARFEDSDGMGFDREGALDNSLAAAGAVYVFRRSAGQWAQEGYLKAPHPDSLDFFGDRIALFGDTIAVGAHGEDGGGDPTDNSAEDAGAVYLFIRSGDTWGPATYVKAARIGPGDVFGWSVALHGHTLAVGAANADGAVADTGAVSLFR